jgi:hypothetical protein
VVVHLELCLRLLRRHLMWRRHGSCLHRFATQDANVYTSMLCIYMITRCAVSRTIPAISMQALSRHSV